MPFLYSISEGLKDKTIYNQWAAIEVLFFQIGDKREHAGLRTHTSFCLYWARESIDLSACPRPH